MVFCVSLRLLLLLPQAYCNFAAYWRIAHQAIELVQASFIHTSTTHPTSECIHLQLGWFVVNFKVCGVYVLICVNGMVVVCMLSALILLVVDLAKVGCIDVILYKIPQKQLILSFSLSLMWIAVWCGFTRPHTTPTTHNRQ